MLFGWRVEALKRLNQVLFVCDEVHMFDLQSDHHTAATRGYFRRVGFMKPGRIYRGRGNDLSTVYCSMSLDKTWNHERHLVGHMMPSYSDLESWGIGDGWGLDVEVSR